MSQHHKQISARMPLQKERGAINRKDASVQQDSTNNHAHKKDAERPGSGGQGQLPLQNIERGREGAATKRGDRRGPRAPKGGSPTCIDSIANQRHREE